MGLVNLIKYTCCPGIGWKRERRSMCTTFLHIIDGSISDVATYGKADDDEKEKVQKLRGV